MSGLISVSHISTRLANVSLLYLMVVVICAAYLGRIPALVSSVCGFIAFNLFLVEPKTRYELDATSEFIALTVFLTTALVIGQLTALLRDRADEAERRRSEMEILAEASWAVTSEHDRENAILKVIELIENIGPVESVVLKLNSDSPKFSKQEARSANTPKLTQSFPVGVDERQIGSVILNLKPERTLQYEENRLVESLVNHIAVLVEKDRLLKNEARTHALIEVDALKTALLSMVSHDFRSPLTTIKASVSALLEDGTPWEPAMQRNLLEAAEQETDRLNRLVGNILDLSKLEGGAWKPKREATEVKELLSSTLSNFSDSENERIRFTVEEKMPEIFIDVVQIEQVLHNLLENALKYSPEEKVIDLEVRNDQLGDNKLVCISILDRGQGLPKGREDKVFDRFYRAEELVESNIPGLGIGLAVCKGLAEANGATLSARQREGGGAAFDLRIPATQDENLEAK